MSLEYSQIRVFETHFLIFHIRRKGAEQSRNRFASCVHSTATGKSLMQETLDWDRILIVQEIWDGERTIVTEEKKIFSLLGPRPSLVS